MLLIHLDGRLGINGVVIADNSIEIAAIDDSIDVEPLPTGVAANFVGLSAFDPAVAGNRIVVRMRGIHEVNPVFRLFRRLKRATRFNEGPLPLGIGLAGESVWAFCRRNPNDAAVG